MELKERIPYLSLRIKKRLLTILEEYLKEANISYRTGLPTLTDWKFDYLEDVRNALDTEFIGNNREHLFNEPIRRKIKHLFPMGSIDKIKRDSLWNRVSAWDSKWMEPKIDGVGLSIEKTGAHRHVLTRGNGEYGDDVSNKYSELLAGEWNGVLRGEAFVTLKDFERIKGYSTPRSYVAGMINSKKDQGKWRFVVYDTLRFNGRLPEKTLRISKLYFNNRKEMLLNILRIERLKIFIPIDGVVLRSNLEFVVKSKLRRDCLCWKFDRELSKATKVLDIIWSMGRTGRLTPILKLEETVINNRKINRVTAHNFSQLTSRKCGIGSEILVEESGQTIPYLKEVLKGTDVVSPEICEGCSSKLVLREKELNCLNENCRLRMRAFLTYFFGRNVLNVPQLSEARIEKLLVVLTTWRKIAYFLTNDTYRVKTLGDTVKAGKIADGITDYLKRKSWTIWHWLVWMNIENLGITWAKRIEDIYSHRKEKLLEDLERTTDSNVRLELPKGSSRKLICSILDFKKGERWAISKLLFKIKLI